MKKMNHSFTTLAKTNLVDREATVMLTPLLEIVNDQVDASYRRWSSDPIITKYNPHGLFPWIPGDIIEYLKGPGRIDWAIIIQEQGKYTHIGHVSLQSVNWINASIELICIIGQPEYWNKGILTWASEQIIKHAFLKLNLNRVWSGTAVTNFGMIKVFIKLGFQIEGCFTEGAFLDGQFVDVIPVGLTFNKWLTYQRTPRDGSLRAQDEEDLNPFKIQEATTSDFTLEKAKERFEEKKELDELKRKLCKNHGITLIEIGWVYKEGKMPKIKFNEMEVYIRKECFKKKIFLSKKDKKINWRTLNVAPPDKIGEI